MLRRRGFLSSLAKGGGLYGRMKRRSCLNRGLLLGFPEDLGFLGAGRVTQSKEGEREAFGGIKWN